MFSGTLAWQSISQTAKNEVKTTINPGGRLHDDFSGPGGTKDIYVENFGTQDIYARIRLDEYMELGKGAGTDDPNREAESLVYGAELDDVTTWTTHIPGGTSATIGDGMESGWVNNKETFHKYWSWTMGGETTYMPTFNLSNESLTADINGTMAGGDSGTAYGDFVDYTLEKNASKTADASCSDEDGNSITTVAETHTVQKTLNAQVITMAEYNSLSDKLAFVGWVYDADGWAYWSQPIEPGTATGLLLDKVENAAKNGIQLIPNQKSFYAINVIGEFVTADDIGSAEDKNGFYSEGSTPPSSDALALLRSIGVETGKVTLSKVTTSGSTEALEDIKDQVLTMLAGAAGTSFTARAAISTPVDGAAWSWTSSDSSIVTVTEDKSDSSRATVAVVNSSTNLGTVTITASYTDPDGTVLASASFVANVPKESHAVGETVTVNRRKYTVVAVSTVTGRSATEKEATQHSAALLVCDSVVTAMKYGTTNSWEKSTVRSWLNGDIGFPKTDPEAVAKALEVTISTYDPSSTAEDHRSDTQDTFFLLSEADVSGKATNSGTTVGNETPYEWEYTAGSKLTSLKTVNNYAWLRSPNRSSTSGSLFVYKGNYEVLKQSSNSTQTSTRGLLYIRPAFWYDLGAVSISTTD